MFPKLNPALRLPTYSDMTLTDYNHLGDQIEMDLEAAMDQSYKEIRAHRLAFQGAMKNLCETTLGEGGMPSDALISALKMAEDGYLPERSTLIADPRFSYLTDPYSRSHFDISPPKYKGRNNLNNPLPVWSSAMWDIFPGTDQEHRVLLSNHRALYHFPHTLARSGGVFVTPPDFDKDYDSNRPPEQNLKDLRALMEQMQTADPYWRIPPRLRKDTTIGVAKKVMEHYEDDWIATIEDEGGNVIGTVSKSAIMGVRDTKEFVWDQKDPSISWATNAAATPAEAYDEMTRDPSRTQNYLLRQIEGRAPEVMTRSLAKQAVLLPPYRYNEKGEGLGYIMYLSVSDPERTKAVVRMMQSGQLRGVQNKDLVLRAPGIMVDTSHGSMGFVEKLLKDLRAEHPDLFIVAGAYDDPNMVSILADTLDAMKGPKGLSPICETYNTGVRLPDYYSQVRLAVAAYANNLPLLGDGIGGEGKHDQARFRQMQMDDSSEMTIRMATPMLIGGQGGGFMIARRTSANEMSEFNGREGKWASGEASAKANQRTTRNGGQGSPRDARVSYGEGVTDRFYFERNPAHLAPALFLLAARMRAYYSFCFSHKVKEGTFEPGEMMRYVQNNLQIIHKGS